MSYKSESKYDNNGVNLKEKSAAIVVMGEAPESEDEDDYVNLAEENSGADGSNELLAGDRPETPPSPSPGFSTNDQTSFQRREKKAGSSSSSPCHDTLLHRKLREKNEVFREELVKLACQPYITATKEIDSLAQQLIKSQRMVQNVSETLRKLSKDLMTIEGTLDSVRTNRQFIPQFTDKLTSNSWFQAQKATSPSFTSHDPQIMKDAYDCSPVSGISSASSSTERTTTEFESEDKPTR